MRKLQRKQQRRERAAVQERRRLQIVADHTGDDEEFNEWLGSLSYAEAVAHLRAGHLYQPALPGMRGE